MSKMNACPGGVTLDRPNRTVRSITLTALLLALLLVTGTITNAASVVTSREDPITGEMHAGPLGLNPPAVRNQGVLPTAIRIANAEVDAEVETVEIVDGVMQNPTGPWVVSWYKQTAKPGENGNSVMAGHVDYWDVGPAVFYNLKDLSQGDEIQVIGEDGTAYTYAVDWMETYIVADLTPEDIDEIVGPTDAPALTLITCGGEFDYATGEYLSRMVVRATRVGMEPGTGVVSSEDPAGADAASAPVVEGGTAVVVETGVNLRAAPSTTSEVVTVLDGGAELTVTGPAEEGDGIVWLPVEDAEGNTGYVAQDFLESQE
ncbi:MAG: sortase [Chloroflexota bacterium]|nr:sortase [Chloroflexota bacterium]